MMPTLIHGIKSELFSESFQYINDIVTINSIGQVSSNLPFASMNMYKDDIEHSVPTHFIPDIKTAINIIPRQPLNLLPANHNIVVPVPSNHTTAHGNELLQNLEVNSVNQGSFNSSLFLQHDASAFRPKNSVSVNASLSNENSSLNENHSNSSENNFDGTVSKPSEALFVKTILPRCKRLAPLWFRSVTTMRERNRGEQRKPSIISNQTQDDWTDISDNVSQMDANEEADSVVNLLKKLYKELPSENVIWFIKCWLRCPETEASPIKCVISRGDAKNRMRRIDCGKGSDKVWRLDTIVGMLFHGLPMSSTDTSMMIHTCKNDLCVRPQHLRFRANSVSLVVVLKALAQAGYVVSKPGSTNANPLLDPNISQTDEFVDVFGPFSIERLQQYRSEHLTATGNALNRLILSPSDSEFINNVEVIRLMLAESNQSVTQSSSGQYKSSKKLNTKEANRYNGTLDVSTTICHADDGSSSAFKPRMNAIEGSLPRKSLKRTASPFNSPSTECNHDSSPSVSSFAMHELSPSKQILLNYDHPDGSANGYQQTTKKVKQVASPNSIVPRQPAKKRMEARTPNALEDVKSTSSSLESNSVHLENLLPQRSLFVDDSLLQQYKPVFIPSNKSEMPTFVRSVPRNELEDDEELLMIQDNCPENSQTPRKSVSAEPKSRNEMLAAVYSQIENSALRKQFAVAMAAKETMPQSSTFTRSASVSGLPNVGGSPTSSHSVTPKILDLANLSENQSEFLRLLSRTPQGRASQEYQQLLETISSMQHQYATKRSPVGDIRGEFYRRLLNSPYNSSPIFLQQNGRGFTPLPVELDAFSYGHTNSGRTTSSNLFNTPSISPFTLPTNSSSSLNFPRNSIRTPLSSELNCPKLEQYSPETGSFSRSPCEESNNST